MKHKLTLLAIITFLAATGCQGPPGSNKAERLLFDVKTNYQAVVIQATNPVTGEAWLQTNLVPVSTELVDKPATTDTVKTVGGIGSAFTPWAGFGSAAALGLLAVWREFRNRKVKGALIQGIETGRALLTETQQGRELTDRFTTWLVRQQNAAGVLGEVSKLVGVFSDKALAAEAAQRLNEAK